jgi:hypothetical protein
VNRQSTLFQVSRAALVAVLPACFSFSSTLPGECKPACPVEYTCGISPCDGGSCATCLHLSCAGVADNSPCTMSADYSGIERMCCGSTCVSRWSNENCGACGAACSGQNVCNLDHVCGDCAYDSECPPGEACRAYPTTPPPWPTPVCTPTCLGACPSGPGCLTDAGCMSVCLAEDCPNSCLIDGGCSPNCTPSDYMGELIGCGGCGEDTDCPTDGGQWQCQYYSGLCLSPN